MIMMKRYTFFVLVLGLLMACSKDEVHKPGPVVTVNLVLPAVENEVAGTRAPGDPGTEVKLDPPTIAYIYFVKEAGGVSYVVNSDFKHLADPVGAPDIWTEVPRKVTISSFFGAPTETAYGGSLKTNGDVVYRYPMKKLQLPDGCTKGRFYVVTSNVALKQGSTNLEDVVVADEDAIKNLTIDFYSDEMKADLPNIYSSPCNYMIGSPSAYYYGTIEGENDVVDLVLYHVASRVDVKWNVASALQATRKIKEMTAANLKAKDCYIFKPMANTTLGSDPDPYSKSLKTADEVGRQWYGRASFYTIPYQTEESTKKYFPFNLVVHNGSAENTTTVKLNMKNADPVFVPWIRVNLTYDGESDFTQSTLTLGD